MSSIDDLFAEAEQTAEARARGVQHMLNARAEQREEHFYKQRFIRYAAWFDITQCKRCKSTQTSFDGWFEERESSSKLQAQESRRVLGENPPPVEGAVRHIRRHNVPYCAVCSKAFTVPLAEEYEDGKAKADQPPRADLDPAPAHDSNLPSPQVP